MNIQLSVSDWLQLPMEVRVKLRDTFGIPKSEGTVIINNVVKSDGTTHTDLSHLTTAMMRSYLGLEEGNDLDYPTLFDKVIEKVHLELNPTEDNKQIDPTQLYVEEWAAVLSRVKGQAIAYRLEDHLESLLKRIFDIKPTVITQPNAEQKRKAGRPKKAK